eukprot:SAG11_NODE_5309_length_1600_cov_1.459027_1_plen_319_part_10
MLCRNECAQAQHQSGEMMVEDDVSFDADFDDFDTESGAPSAPVARGQPLDLAEARAVRILILGGDEAAHAESWMQGIEWNPALWYGLWQHKGGPCGVIAALQASLIAVLQRRGALSEGSAPLGGSERGAALCEALAEVLWRCGGGKRAVVALGAGGGGLTLGRGFEEGLTTFSFDERVGLLDFLSRRAMGALCEPGGCGVLLFMVSALLSHGVEAVRNDMDDGDASMIGGHSYCSQELVNLLLTGRATSNVFDGDRDVGGLASRGVVLDGAAPLGFLTLFEALNPGHIEVGEQYKCPSSAVWVVCAESHYSVLFCKPPL